MLMLQGLQQELRTCNHALTVEQEENARLTKEKADLQQQLLAANSETTRLQELLHTTQCMAWQWSQQAQAAWHAISCWQQHAEELQQRLQALEVEAQEFADELQLLDKDKASLQQQVQDLAKDNSCLKGMKASL
jgi:predicted  nucleic acid-binding Zn-ribbon protein